MLGLQRVETTAQLRMLALEGGEVYDVGQVGVQEPAMLALGLADRLVKTGALGLKLDR